MFGVNWIDLVIIGLLLAAVFRGLRVRFWSQLLAIAGLLTGLFGVGWLSAHGLKFIDDPLTYTLINGNIVLMSAVVLAIAGNSLGYRIHFILIRGERFRLVEPSLSISLSLVSMLAAAWVAAAYIGRLPFEAFSNTANDSAIVQALNHRLPDVPRTFTLLGKYVDANQPPKVSVGADTPRLPAIPPLSTAGARAAQQAEASMVRITSFGCGGIVSGSGFVVADKLVATNAHVIAGVRRPIVKHQSTSFEAVPVYFDKEIDFALLQVSGLQAPAIPFREDDVPDKTLVAVLGYPDSEFREASGVVLAKVLAEISSIYGIGTTGRDIYGVQMKVAPGSSGGPLIREDGSLAGVVFSRSTEVNDYGYALTTKTIQDPINKTILNPKRVGTGVCQ